MKDEEGVWRDEEGVWRDEESGLILDDERRVGYNENVYYSESSIIEKK